MRSLGSAALEHTLAYLSRLDLLIRRDVLRAHLAHPEQAADEFRGLYVSDEEVRALLDSAPAAARPIDALPDDDRLDDLDRAIGAATDRIATLEAAEGREADALPLVRLASLFGLSDLERDTLVICLAAELDLKYERLYAYLQDDVTKKRPTVDLVMRLLCPTVDSRLEAWRHFAPDAPLLRWNLVTLNDDPGARRPVLLARYLKLDDRVVGYLLGSDAVDSRLAPHVLATGSDSDPELASDVVERLTRWADTWMVTWTSGEPVILLHGRYGTGKRAAAAFLANALGRPLLMLSLTDMLAGGLPLGQGLGLAEREALLTSSLLGWCDVDAVLQPEGGDAGERRAFVQALARGRVPTVLLARGAWEPANELDRRPFVRFELPEPTYAERRDCWTAGLDGRTSKLDKQGLSALASRFRLTSGQIRDAVSRAQTIAWSRDPLDYRVEVEDVDDACRRQAQHHLGTLARKLEPRHSWEDIVLPWPQMTALRLLTATVRLRSVVYGDWGFDRKLPLGKGLLALFSGPSGTGKTMAAGIIAHDLGLDIYKIDLSSVVSKYIGETEKNLERIFSEAQDSDAILFFDEADALFGKRSEVRDAHDRYANIETAYLLQRTEEYSGLVILASNVKKNMDEAFVRRIHFIVEFPFPEEPERLEIWRRTFPREAPRAEDIDLGFLARKLKLAGGSIRNIILTGAFLAADEGQPIAMRHLVCGASYEFQKMGRLIVEADFERYFHLVRLEDGTRRP